MSAPQTPATIDKPVVRAGTKGEAILAALTEHPDWTRKQVAEAVGCTVGRVGEVCAAAGVHAAPGQRGGRSKLTPEQRDLIEAIKALTPDEVAKVAEIILPLGVAVPATETRTGRCEHERSKKAKTGTCKVCAPVAS